MRISIIVFALVLIFLSLSIFFSLAYAQDSLSATTSAQKVNSYELFWPITAGRVQGDPLYTLKLFKEGLREMFIFSDFKKAEYNISLSEKRTVEVEKLLLELKDYQNAQKTLETAKEKRQKAYDHIQKAKGQERYVVDLENRMRDSLGRQKELLTYLSSQVPSEQKDMVEENISSLNDLLTKLQ